MREIIFDTETTGIRHQDGHRIIEIGAVEMIDRIPTGKTFHEYIKPDDQQVEQGAFEVHGISNEQLADKPLFVDIFPKFWEFFSDGLLIAHNAPFDIGFFNMELGRIGQPPIEPERVIDTLQIARQKFPGAKNSLDVLCGRFGISNAHRKLHGALLDSELLAEVYIELTGGKQVGLALDETATQQTHIVSGTMQLEITAQKPRPSPLPDRLTEGERHAHQEFIEGMGDMSIWQKWNAAGSN